MSLKDRVDKLEIITFNKNKKTKFDIKFKKIMDKIDKKLKESNKEIIIEVDKQVSGALDVINAYVDKLFETDRRLSELVERIEHLENKDYEREIKEDW